MTHRTRPADWDWERVRALCLKETRRVLDDATADDAAQEATIRVWRHRDRCRNPAHPEPWIARIARREALRLVGRRRDLSPTGDEDAADPRQDFSGLLASLDLRREMNGMTGQDRMLLIGHYWQDLPDSELAMQLGLAEVTVRVRLHRIRQRLRDRLMEL